MRVLKITILFLLTLLFCFTAIAKDLTGKEIMMKVDNKNNGDDRKMVMKMTLVNRRGRKRVREMTVFSKDYGKDVKSLFFFRKPSDVKGMGFLTWGYDDPSKDDDRWLYMPALKRSKRISGSSKNDYFMGSDLTYDDMGSRSVDEDIHTYMGEEIVDGYACWIVSSVPKDTDCLYSKVVQRIRKDALISIKTDFYSKNGSLLKTLYNKELKKYDNIWTTHLTEVTNVQENHKTILKIENVNYNCGLKNQLFKVSSLEKGKIR